MSDDELAGYVETLFAFEQARSAERKALFGRIDALSAELVRRYRDGEASVDGLLSDEHFTVDGTLLEVKDVKTYFKTARGLVRAVDGQNQWKWETGAALGTATWNPGEPNDSGSLGANADCVQFQGADPGLVWSDKNCEETKEYLCELPL